MDEAITQNRAEHFAYAFARKSRPPMKRYTNGKLFHGEAYQTNFDFYGELQTPATMFGRTLRGIGKMENDEAALMELCNRANNPNFAKRIIEEYTKDSERDAGNEGRQVAIAFFFDENVSNKAIERINDKDDADDFGYNVDNRAMPEYHANTKNK